MRLVHDHHVRGIFPETTWRRLVENAGLEVVDVDAADPHEGERAVFVGRK